LVFGRRCEVLVKQQPEIMRRVENAKRNSLHLKNHVNFPLTKTVKSSPIKN